MGTDSLGQHLKEKRRSLRNGLIKVAVAGTIAAIVGVYAINYFQSKTLVQEPQAQKQTISPEKQEGTAENSDLGFRAAFDDYVNTQTELAYICGAMSQACPNKKSPSENSRCVELIKKYNSLTDQVKKEEIKLEKNTGDYGLIETIKMPDCL